MQNGGLDTQLVNTELMIKRVVTQFSTVYLKAASVALNFLTLAALARIETSANAVDYLIYISISMVLSAFFDRGVSSYNNIVTLANNELYLTCKTFDKLDITIIIFFTLFSIFYLEYSLILTISILVTAFGNIALLRLSKVFRRSGDPGISILVYDLAIAITRFLMLPVLYWLELHLFILVAAVIQLMIYYYFVEVKKRIVVNRVMQRYDNRAYTYSVITTLKDQVSSFLLDLVPVGQVLAVATITRTVGLVNIILVHFYSTLPMKIKRSESLKLDIVIIVCVYLSLIIGLKAIIPIISEILFGESQEVDSWAFLSIFLLYILLNYNVVYLNAKGKFGMALIIDVLYFMLIVSAFIWIL